MTQNEWVSRHPYLKPIADLQSLVRTKMETICRSRAPTPNWGGYAGDYEAGVPLLGSNCIQIDLTTVGQELASVIETLVFEPLPGNTAVETPFAVATETRSVLPITRFALSCRE